MSALRVIVGVVLGAIGYLGTLAVDRGVTHAWPAWGRGLWAVGLVSLAMAAVLLVVTGLGLLDTEILQHTYPPQTPGRRRITLAHFLVVYVGILTLSIGLAFTLEYLAGIPPERTIFLSIGSVFCVAGTRRPWWLFDSIRCVGWFAAIPSDRVMQFLLFVLGGLTMISSFWL
jgi:hypothetical protein